MDVAFAHYNGGVDTSTKIRTTTYEKKIFFRQMGKAWNPEWDTHFTEQKDKTSISSVYDQLVDDCIADITSELRS
jgi:hypothetical protein